MNNAAIAVGVATISRLLKIIYVSFAKELYQRDYNLQKRPMMWRIHVYDMTYLCSLGHIYVFFLDVTLQK